MRQQLLGYFPQGPWQHLSSPAGLLSLSFDLLADLLRYTLYETDAECVPLARKLEFLDDYLALERLRHPEATVRHESTGPVVAQQLAPLLLHPFYEQLFAGLGTTGTATVTSDMHVEPNALIMGLHRQ